MVLFERVHRYLIFMLVSAALLILGAPAYASDGGPDRYGYRYVDSRFSDTDWYSYSAMTDPSGEFVNFVSLGKDDEGYYGITNRALAQIAIGFEFEFYGVRYDTLYISGNGYIVFDPSSLTGAQHVYDGQSVPADDQVNNFIAPFWSYNDVLS